jgi:RimJ/RimL family protein N-acetyltransferase
MNQRGMDVVPDVTVGASIPSDAIVLETERLQLRRMRLADAADLLRIFSDPVAMRFYPGTKDHAQTVQWIKWNEESYEANGFGLWIATIRESGEFAGQCGLTIQEAAGKREVEIGYLFLRSLWNRGLATEAAAGCRDFALNALGLTRLISLIDPANFASRRVAEKVGMTPEGYVNKWEKDLCLYSLQIDAVSG